MNEEKKLRERREDEMLTLGGLRRESEKKESEG